MYANPVGWILGKAVLPLGDRFFRQTVMPRLDLLRKAQWWPKDRLDAARQASLRELAYVCFHEFPFYRAQFERARLHWDDLRTVADLQRLPIVTKAMIRAVFPHGVTRDNGLPTHEEVTSGSTGDPFVIREDSGTASMRRAAFLLSLEWAGWRLGEAHVQTGAQIKRDLERTLKDWVFRCHYVSALQLDDASLDKTLHFMDRKRIRHLWGFPVALHCLARRASQRGWNRQLTSVVTWADALHPHYRAEIERVFGVPVLDTYGVSEGMQIAAQCGHGSSYHVNMLDTIVELVDEDGRPVPPGQPGRVILTRLHPGCMPFLRYEVGDLAVAEAPHRCSCGRESEMIEKIAGRDTDVIQTPGGQRLTVHFFMDRIESVPEIEAFQVVRRADGRLLVRAVAARPDQALARRVRNALAEGGVTDMETEVEFVDSIPVSRAGKRRFVIDEAVRGGREKTARF